MREALVVKGSLLFWLKYLTEICYLGIGIEATLMRKIIK